MISSVLVLTHDRMNADGCCSLHRGLRVSALCNDDGEPIKILAFSDPEDPFIIRGYNHLFIDIIIFSFLAVATTATYSLARKIY